MAAERYSCEHSTASGTTTSLLNVNGNGSRAAWFEIIIGCVATPADTAVNWGIHRTTAAAVGGTSLNEVALDSDSPAATAIGTGGTWTTEPTIAANTQLVSISMNQRVTFRWAAHPYGELITDPAANNGLTLRSESTSTGSAAYEATVMWME